MFKFISFGSGSCGNCYYLYTENDGLLIDVGVGTRSLKKSFGDYGLHMLGGFSSILVTHDHADHIKSVGSLSKKLDLPVYATQLVHWGMDRNYCMKMKLAQANRHYVVKGEPFETSGFRITPFGVPHDSSDNVGYSIEHEGVVFTLLTDVGHITEEMKQIIKNTDYLVIEANYDPQMLQNGPYPRYLHRTPEQSAMRRYARRELYRTPQAHLALPSKRGEQPSRTGTQVGRAGALGRRH